ncbi:MAG TPA: hypothetical protein PK668_27555 [Myxococcota bacterium]|nr:hypothetical protein [Myxococcota bacterium]HRY97285.1 hypothetical protein [Myxococcota bacterium]
MRSFMETMLVVSLVLGLGGCGESGGTGTLAFKASRIEAEPTVNSVTFTIQRISLSETGESWVTVAENLAPITVASDAVLDLEQADLPKGDYHGVKVELAAGLTWNLAAGGSVQQDWPDILLYRVPSGMYRYSSADNGFPETQQYWEFTTRNEAMSGPVEVEANETRFLVLGFKPLTALEAADDVGLAASCTYTAFLE